MELDQIEVLNIKCTQALAGEMSSSDKSDESDGENEVKNMQTLFSCKKKSKTKSKTQNSTSKAPSYHQNWMAGPGNLPLHSQQLMTPHFAGVPTMASQMSMPTSYAALPSFSQFAHTAAVPLQEAMTYQQPLGESNSTFHSHAFGSQSMAQNFSQNSPVMPNTFGQKMQTPTIPTPPTTTSTPIKPQDIKEVNTYFRRS